jgi:hypothetical protein
MRVVVEEHGTTLCAHDGSQTHCGSALLEIIVLVASHAVESRPEATLASFRREHPGTLLPGRSVPHVLAVTAFQQRNPVAHLVAFEPDDGAFHGRDHGLRSVHPHIYRNTMLS